MDKEINDLIVKRDGFDSSILCRDVSGIAVPYISYPSLAAYPELVHGFSTRLGGVSEGYLGSMNLSFSRGDREEAVRENHRRLGRALGYDPSRLVFSDQVHDVTVRVVTEADAGRGIAPDKEKLSGVDGLVTNCRNLPLITFYADCVPLFVYDPVEHVIGLAHSGWKGTVKKMGQVLVHTMQEHFSSDPKNLVCAIGPCICQSCYEVGQEVIDAFCQAFTEEVAERFYQRKENGKYLLDLRLACVENFLAAGVLRENISLPDFCTCCNSELLFSHRATAGKRGNLAAVMVLV